jgi:dissimilatory sulfite reductase (desulfoviridin) alpha/beta subunit
MEVSYLIKDLDDHYTIDVETSPEPPTARVMDIADQMDEDGVVAIEREGNGEIHILKVAPDDVERIANSLDDDEKPYKNAVDVGVDYVEVRSDADEGVISIRYLP